MVTPLGCIARSVGQSIGRSTDLVPADGAPDAKGTIEIRDEREVGAADLEPFFAPPRVAVVGASRQQGKLGHDVLVESARRGFRSHMIDVNPNAAAGKQIAGWWVIPSPPQVQGRVGLALIALQAASLPAAVKGVC